MKIGNQNVTRKQHTVQQQYLSSWLNNDSFLFAMDAKSKRIFSSSTEGVCSKRDFYKVSKINDDEKKFILKLIPDNLQDVKDFIDSLIQTINSDYYVQIDDKGIEKDLNHYLKEHINEIMEPANILIGEELTHLFEQGLDAEIRESLNLQKDEFMADDLKRVDFFAYLFFQIYRTPKIKAMLKQYLESLLSNNLNIDANRIYPLFVITFSLIQASIVSSYNRHHITFLVNRNDQIEFFTSDNPVINICNIFDDEGVPTDYKLYWPISPSISIILSNNISDKIRNVSQEEVHYYNTLLYKECERIIIAQKKDHLVEYAK